MGPLQELIDSAKQFLIPNGLTVIVNGVTLPNVQPTKDFEETLPTEVAGDDGVMMKTKRKTTIQLHCVKKGDVAMLYELGIPVV